MRRWTTWLLVAVLSLSLCAGTALAAGSGASSGKDNLTVKNGLEEKNGSYYFYQHGEKVKGWQTAYDEWCYFQPSSGKLQTGWLKDNGSWYCLHSNGTMARNETITSGGKRYTFCSWGGLTETETVQTTNSAASENSATVYVSNNGKIHTKSNCSGMKHYTTMTYDEAVALGYVKCKKCD